MAGLRLPEALPLGEVEAGMSVSTAENRRHEAVVVSPRPRAVTDSYRLAWSFLILMSLATVDVFNFLDRGGAMRYLILLVPIGTVVWLRMQEPSIAPSCGVPRRPTRSC